MKLSSRLLSCASMVRPGGVAADVGTDHGYLAVYLVEQGICPVVFASDIREGPLSAARRSAEKAGLTEQIRFCLSDGLRELPVSGIDTVICAGMGGENIIHILESEPKVFDPEKQLILQPQSKTAELRRWLGETVSLSGGKACLRTESSSIPRWRRNTGAEARFPLWNSICRKRCCGAAIRWSRPIFPG